MSTVAVPSRTAPVLPVYSVQSEVTTVTLSPTESAEVSISTAMYPSSETSISAPCSYMTSLTLSPAAAYIFFTLPETEELI